MKQTTRFASIVDHAIDGLANISPDNTYGCDLHNKLFNEDYFIIGYYAAEEWLKANPGIFAAIEEIREYEESNFGEVTTDFSSSEKVVNMYAYIAGENLLNESETLRDKWNVLLSEEDIAAIREELENL